MANTRRDLAKARKKGKAAAGGQIRSTYEGSIKRLTEIERARARKVSRIQTRTENLISRDREFAAKLTKAAEASPYGGRTVSSLTAQGRAAVAGDKATAEGTKTAAKTGRMTGKAGKAGLRGATKSSMSILDVLAQESRGSDLRFLAEMQHQQQMEQQRFQNQLALQEAAAADQRRNIKLQNRLMEEDAGDAGSKEANRMLRNNLAGAVRIADNIQDAANNANIEQLVTQSAAGGNVITPAQALAGIVSAPEHLLPVVEQLAEAYVNNDGEITDTDLKNAVLVTDETGILRATYRQNRDRFDRIMSDYAPPASRVYVDPAQMAEARAVGTPGWEQAANVPTPPQDVYDKIGDWAREKTGWQPSLEHDAPNPLDPTSFRSSMSGEPTSMAPPGALGQAPTQPPLASGMMNIEVVDPNTGKKEVRQVSRQEAEQLADAGLRVRPITEEASRIRLGLVVTPFG